MYVCYAKVAIDRQHALLGAVLGAEYDSFSFFVSLCASKIPFRVGTYVS